MRRIRRLRTLRPDDVLELLGQTGNHPPRVTRDLVTVLEVTDEHVRYRLLDGTQAGRIERLPRPLFDACARRPLDPTPPGPPVAGDQPALDLENTMTDTDTTEAPALTLDTVVVDRIKKLLGAIYWCAAELDRDPIADDAGEPLRIIGNEIELALGLNLTFDGPGAWENAEQDAKGSDLGLAHAIECYTMPSQIVRDAIEAADLGKALREALNVDDD